jgi:hypothetical protein
MSKPNDLHRFRYVDTAIGGPQNRNHIRDIDDFARLTNSNLTDAYTMHMRGADDLARHVEETLSARTGAPSIAGYNGEAYLDGVYYDFDAKNDVKRALADVRTFIRALDDAYGIGSAIEAWFTGSKGFHARVPSSLFDYFQPAPSQSLSAAHRRVALMLVEGLGLTTLDTSIYSKARLGREDNTRHSRALL